MIRTLTTAVAGVAALTVRALLPHRGAGIPTDTGDPAPVATRQSTTYVDDLDDTVEAEETVTFALDGTSYEIDLSAEHAASFRDDVATWVEHARRTSGGRKSPARATTKSTGAGRTSTDRDRAGSVREWARANGHEVSDRGRIPATVQQAYDNAH